MTLDVSLHFGKFPSSGGVTKKLIISVTLTIVPAIIPIIPRKNRKPFLVIFSFPETPLKSSQNTIVCIIDGAINASVDEATAPINEMKRSIFGIAAAKATSYNLEIFHSFEVSY